jgi:biotin carboxyl carrier protein
LSKYKLNINGQHFDVEILSENNNSYQVMVNGEILQVNKDIEPDTQISKPNIPQPQENKPLQKPISESNTNQKSTNESLDAKLEGNSIKALMPGKVLKVLVSEGENVESGTPLLVIESMKMENIISSNKSGKVGAVHVKIDDNVQYDQPLIEIK